MTLPSLLERGGGNQNFVDRDVEMGVIKQQQQH